MGGFDIAYGRWDNPSHKLTDPNNIWPGKDYKNDRVREVSTPRNFTHTDINKNK